MDVKNICKWCCKFLSGDENVYNKERSGRPSHSGKAVQAVEAEMLKNHRVTVKDMEEKLGGVCSRDSIRVILKDKLNYLKVSSRRKE